MISHSFFYPLFSAFLFVLASPSVGIWPLIFCAFVPLISGLEKNCLSVQRPVWRAFLFGYIPGIAYTLSLFFWVVHVNYWSIFPITLGFACLHGLFALGVVLALQAGFNGTKLSLWLACLWVSIEILASDVFFSLPSYGVGYYLWTQPLLVQIADITGVFGVSFWVISINILIYQVWQKGIRQNIPWSVFVLCLSSILLLYGLAKQGQYADQANKSQNISVISLHTTTLEKEKQDPNYKQSLFTQLKQLTEQQSTISVSNEASLVIWPETSMPIFLRSIEEINLVKALLNTASENKAFIVMGARSFVGKQSGDLEQFNASFLVPPSGYIAQEYHKNILVPWMEGIPFSEYIPEILGENIPALITAGKKLGVMHLEQNAFGIFICWESFFPEYVRSLANQSAEFLVNISNEEPAFGGFISAYAIPIPHLVFRTIENRRQLVRSNNWGAALFISPFGEIQQKSEVGTQGHIQGFVEPRDDISFFTKHGFVLAKGLFVITSLWLIYILLRVYRQRH